MLEPASLRGFLESQMPAALDLLRRMVGINSFTENLDGVARLARLTAEGFAPLGFTAESVRSTNPAWGDHLFLTRSGRSPRSILMISHLDTVFPPDEEARNDFRWQPDGDRIYGPGTNDIKGGTVMIWLVLAALQAQAPELFADLTWRVCLNSSEEVFSPDFGEVCRARCDRHTLAALARSLPSSAWQAVTWRTGAKGPQRSRFAKGKVWAAHGGKAQRQPERVAAWLPIEWAPGVPAPGDYWRADGGAQPAGLRRLVRIARSRWRVGLDDRELQAELGLDRYEGCPWLGWHPHVTLVSLAFAFRRQEQVRAKKNFWCDAAANPPRFAGGAD